MKRSKIFLLIFSSILVYLWMMPDGMLAQDRNQAALVIRYSDQSVQTACVDFTEPEINGLELLQRSGLDLELDVQGLGAAVCRIGQTGCPADDCWCQCKGGGDCVYWSYWQKLSGQWKYSQGGASIYTVSGGDIQGWSWGPGAVNQAYSPPDLTFENVCTSAAVDDATATPTATSNIFMVDDTPTNEPLRSQQTETPTTTPSATPTIPPTATTINQLTAVPTNTPQPTVTTALVPAATEPISVVAPIEPQPIVSQTVVVAEPSTNHEREQKAESSLQVTPTPLPQARDDELNQTPPAAIIALAEPGETLPTRQSEMETKKRVEVTADQPKNFLVIGTEAHVPDLRALPVTMEEQINYSSDDDAPSSLLSYGIFGLIVFGLGGWLLLLSIKSREGPLPIDKS
jgi:hypothetical protein